MSAWWSVAWATLLHDLRRLKRSRALVVLTVVQALLFLTLVTIFGLTGSRAPTALIDDDHSALSASFTRQLETTHNSFDIRPMSRTDADALLRDGRLVASITIPQGFETTVTSGGTVALPVVVDNVDVDLTDDIQRALPSAIRAFGIAQGFPGIRVQPAEVDLVDHDTGFIPYLVVSALALDALIVAAMLSGTLMAREWEEGSMSAWQDSPAPQGAVLFGKVGAASVVSAGVLLLAGAVVVLGYRVVPVRWGEALAGLALSIVIFACAGAWLGALVRRTMPMAALVFGMSLPLYLASGSLEPARFDGNVIWVVAHASPMYQAVAVLQDGFHGLRVTPEPVALDLALLAAWGVVAALAARRMMRRRPS